VSKAFRVRKCFLFKLNSNFRKFQRCETLIVRPCHSRFSDQFLRKHKHKARKQLPLFLGTTPDNHVETKCLRQTSDRRKSSTFEEQSFEFSIHSFAIRSMRCFVPNTWRTSLLTTKLPLEPHRAISARIQLYPRPHFTRNFTITQYPTMPKDEPRQKSRTDWANTYQKYKYTPLDASRNSIRLLRLRVAPDSSWPIRCSLFHTTLEEAPPYVALSYTWGDAVGSSPILVNSDTVTVTRNLRHALLHLRPECGEEVGDLVMWIDAICINQDDISERNTQIANMRAIYQHAASVAVWLGLEKSGSAAAIRMTRDLNACQAKEEVMALLDSPEAKGHLEYLVTLFRRQYWWRIWVIQEVSCAKSAIVHCGEDSIPWATLDNVCDILKTVESQLRSLFYTHPSYIRTLTHGGPRGLQLSRYSPHLSAPPLLELLLSHKSKKSTDPKDKVYALVGISSSRHTFGKIDYSLSMREIYAHTARHLISTTHKLDVICVKQHDIDQFSLPSWVTDWTRLPSASGAVVIGLHHHLPPFTASGSTLASFQFIHDGYVLRTKGIAVDTIRAVGMPYKKRGPPSEIVPLLEVFHDWWNAFVASFSNSLPSQVRFARAISCGSWSFPDAETYAGKLEAIFALSDQMLSDSDMLRLDPPNRSSTMGSSVASLVDDEEVGVEDVEEGEKERLSAALEAGLMMNQRRLFFSRDGFVGLGPWNTTKGDIICVLLGCRSPVVLRKENEHYVLIGEAYIEGFMNGEAMDALRDGEFVLETFEIH
jgi:Heterokaryon incompatibility protein (HET)